MRLVGAGDSWCWGAELVDPIIDPEPIMNMPGGGFERQSIPENIEYRLKNRYINRFADMVGADELVDLSEAVIIKRCNRQSVDGVASQQKGILIRQRYFSELFYIYRLVEPRTQRVSN